MICKPDSYNYWQLLLNHIKSPEVIFGSDFVYPRQLEIHLPGNGEIPCNLHCTYCQGRLFEKGLGKWEDIGLSLIENLQGAIPYHIYGGAYTEPTMNKYLLQYLKLTKKYTNHFGIHTNGTYFITLDQSKVLDSIVKLATDKQDYISYSLDAGTERSWCRVKGNKKIKFKDVLTNIKLACSFSSTSYSGGPAIRICYIITEEASTKKDFESIVSFAKLAKVDSLRFSIPYAHYTNSFDDVRKYKRWVEHPNNEKYKELLNPYLTSKEDKPHIFYVDPYSTDIDRYTFNQCVYSYYQITLGADGYVYKCSSCAAPTARNHRLGKITDDVDTFKYQVMLNHNQFWNCQSLCFDKGLRCNRQALEMQTKYQEWKNGSHAIS